MKAQRKELKTDARLLTKAHPSSGRSLGLCACVQRHISGIILQRYIFFILLFGFICFSFEFYMNQKHK